MKLLLTGASSFTGYWFAQTLRSRGHEVLSPLLGKRGSYSGVRGERVAQLESLGVVISWETPFGSDGFFDLVGEGIDMVCHHAAHVENYKSPDFDVVAAIHQNTRNVKSLFERAKKAGIRAIVHTGSVFEEGEGCGESPLRAFSPYGLSKGLTHQIFHYWSQVSAVPLSKFVIPNPFGPFEEPRFCAYLLQCWTKKTVATVKTPAYIRDNIPVSLLALSYADFVEKTYKDPTSIKYGPMGYVETQGAFAQRFAQEIGNRLSIRTPLEFLPQTDFSEPLIRINKDSPHIECLGWNEEIFWNELGDYYRRVYAIGG